AGEARLAVGRGLDAVAFAAEAIGQRQTQAGLVFDDQHARRHAHDATSAPSPRRRTTVPLGCPPSRPRRFGASAAARSDVSRAEAESRRAPSSPPAAAEPAGRTSVT